jgi:Sulfotransferase domain
MLQVIGAGFGRTGTLSLKAALERLLGAPCYHMAEVFAHLDHAPAWTAAVRGDASQLPGILDGYAATVDWPACELWAELALLYPDAKVLLSTRPTERWWASYEATIHQLQMQEPTAEQIAESPAALGALWEMAIEVITKRSFGTDEYRSLHEDDFKAAYERHNDEVRRTAPADRFLDFDVVQGWEPLCAFLGVDVPDEPFPNVNDRDQFWATFGAGPVIT